MKFSLLTVSITAIILFSNCKKSSDTSNPSSRLNAMLGTWTVHSLRCYPNTGFSTVYADPTYLKFNSDMTGGFYIATVTQTPNFTFKLLPDDSTFVTLATASSSVIQDTMVIVTLTPNLFVFHGKNTFNHYPGTPFCEYGNYLDSLYR